MRLHICAKAFKLLLGKNSPSSRCPCVICVHTISSEFIHYYTHPTGSATIILRFTTLINDWIMSKNCSIHSALLSPRSSLQQQRRRPTNSHNNKSPVPIPKPPLDQISTRSPIFVFNSAAPAICFNSSGQE
jgi:hypothetical protein